MVTRISKSSHIQTVDTILQLSERALFLFFKLSSIRFDTFLFSFVCPQSLLGALNGLILLSLRDLPLQCGDYRHAPPGWAQIIDFLLSSSFLTPLLFLHVIKLVQFISLFIYYIFHF